jgi:hypothetical protein
MIQALLVKLLLRCLLKGVIATCNRHLSYALAIQVVLESDGIDKSMDLAGQPLKIFQTTLSKKLSSTHHY